MTVQDGSDTTAQSARVIPANRYRGDVLYGTVEIHAYTKHGATSMVSVLPPESLEKGEVLKTQAWILGAKQFVVVAEHKRPMKIPGLWYEVRVIKSKE